MIKKELLSFNAEELSPRLISSERQCLKNLGVELIWDKGHEGSWVLLTLKGATRFAFRSHLCLRHALLEMNKLFQFNRLLFYKWPAYIHVEANFVMKGTQTVYEWLMARYSHSSDVACDRTRKGQNFFQTSGKGCGAI